MAIRQPKKANATTIKKGEVKNPKGRPKGSENKRTKEQREAFLVIMELLEKRMMDGDDVIKNLNPRSAGELYATLLNYQKPKLANNKVESDVKQDVKIEVNFKPFNNRFTAPENNTDSTGEGTVNE